MDGHWLDPFPWVPRNFFQSSRVAILCMEGLIADSALELIASGCTELEARDSVSRKIGLFVCRLLCQCLYRMDLFLSTPSYGSFTGSEVCVDDPDCMMSLKEFNSVLADRGIGCTHRICPITVFRTTDGLGRKGEHIVTHAWRI